MSSRPAVLVSLVAVLAACGGDDDGGSSADAGGGGAADAAAGVDAGAADAGDEDLCPGELTFEALVADAESRMPVVEVEVAEVGGSNLTASAPNGRAVLCLPAGGDAQVRSTRDAYLDRLDTLAGDAVEAAAAAAQPYPLDVMDAVAADTLLAALGPERDGNDSLLLVSVVTYPDGQPLVGASVSIDVVDNDGAFARDAKGAFAASPGAAIEDGRLLMFANVALTGGAEDGRAAITVTTPDDYDGTCVGPASVELVAGGVAGALFACQ
jgi:hypothetical protein